MRGPPSKDRARAASDQRECNDFRWVYINRANAIAALFRFADELGNKFVLIQDCFRADVQRRRIHSAARLGPQHSPVWERPSGSGSPPGRGRSHTGLTLLWDGGWESRIDNKGVKAKKQTRNQTFKQNRGERLSEHPASFLRRSDLAFAVGKSPRGVCRAAKNFLGAVKNHAKRSAQKAGAFDTHPLEFSGSMRLKQPAVSVKSDS